MSGTSLVLGRPQKAAAVLLAVGSERASRVLSHLSEDEIEQLAVEVAKLGDVAPHELESILVEFHAEAVANQHLISGGEAHARELLRSIHGPGADDIIDRLMASSEAAPFNFLRLHEPAEVLQHLRDEHPQTIALVLAHLPARVGAQLLGGFDPEVQVSVATRLASLKRADPAVVSHIEDALRGRLGEVRRRSDHRDGVKELADMLNQTDRATERSILGELESLDPDLAERVRGLMFVFEDLVTLDERSLQEVLRQIDAQVLATALKGVSEDLRANLERNLSERMRLTVSEEIDLLGQVRLRDVEEAQTSVVRKARELEQEGVIVLARGKEEFVA